MDLQVGDKVKLIVETETALGYVVLINDQFVNFHMLAVYIVYANELILYYFMRLHTSLFGCLKLVLIFIWLI